MRKDRLCEKIIEDNYPAVFRFCKARLYGDIYGAEECTQEVFLLFVLVWKVVRFPDLRT